ncbi:unnamed protein product [Symbiodinium natans]|uniref:Poly [ADP-ribose] polymerase n=1 Tax=Symbiodinium natans TaxID=878477 RepID=A0A812UVP2_9DINO|nr:unnamed protein product [Symbiodinium natans]
MRAALQLLVEPDAMPQTRTISLYHALQDTDSPQKSNTEQPCSKGRAVAICSTELQTIMEVIPSVLAVCSIESQTDMEVTTTPECENMMVHMQRQSDTNLGKHVQGSSRCDRNDVWSRGGELIISLGLKPRPYQPYAVHVYTAECSSKSDEYGRDDGGNTYPSLHAMLVCKCFVGVPYVTDAAGDHVMTARDGGHHCICGDREAKVGTYREFIFFDERQVYPEYAIIYRRQYDKTKVPEEMVVPTTGTTGRFWQMKAPDWRNVPPEVNKALVQAMKDGESEVSLTLGGTEYVFNLTEKKGTNTRTGNKVPLRAPMVK